MCGDHLIIASNSSKKRGSPPHVRGPLAQFSACVRQIGITPACAGTTQLINGLLKMCRDHPRMCGDHKSWKGVCLFCWGSPPHVRGPHLNRLVHEIVHGITPACAGTTHIAYNANVRFWDHPRMCGDHSFNCNSISFNLGSPPHVRGPLMYACLNFGHRDHPRMCGDHRRMEPPSKPRQGSPPHVRGPRIPRLAGI